MSIHYYNNPASVDASFGNGGITGPGGQLVQLREYLLESGAYPGFSKKTLADHAYTVVETLEDVEKKWPIILSYKPDFIKFHLVHSDEHSTRRDDPKYFGQKGMNPELARLIVELGHANGLRVAAHALTGHDFGVAVRAGVDEITHMPGYESPQWINAEDATLAGSKGVTVITTLNAAEAAKNDTPAYAAIRETQIANLRLLKENGVRIAVGSDAFHGDSRNEAEYLRQLGVFTDLEILIMWTRDCAQTTFPDRFIGELREQFEASFIVLERDPIKDWSALDQIQPLVKFCESCHGSGGQSTRADIPSIAGKQEDYILVSLEQYYYYERSCPDVEYENMDGELETLSMCKVTSQVNKQQALALGRYFAAQSPALPVQEE